MSSGNRIGRSKSSKPATTAAAVHAKTEPEAKRQKTGIEWMVAKRRLTQIQAKAGTKYGLHYRKAAVDGLDPLRSCLNDEPRGGGGLAILARPATLTGARESLLRAREALGFHAEMIAACDLICGRGFTPWEVAEKGKGAQRDVERIQVILALALDLLDAHYRLTE